MVAPRAAHFGRSSSWWLAAAPARDPKRLPINREKPVLRFEVRTDTQIRAFRLLRKMGFRETQTRAALGRVRAEARIDLIRTEQVLRAALAVLTPAARGALDSSSDLELKKFILARADCSRVPGLDMAG